MPVQVVHESPGTQLADPIAVNYTAGNHATAGYRVVEGGHRQSRFHTVADGIARDTVGEHILDGAQMELAFSGPVFGNIFNHKIFEAAADLAHPCRQGHRMDPEIGSNLLQGHTSIPITGHP